MRVTIRLFAILRERVGSSEIDLEEVPAGTTVGELKQLAATAHPALGDLSSVAGVVGTDYAAPDQVVKEGDDVAFLPPVSGGCPDEDESGALERGIFVLEADPIDLLAVQTRVAHPSCGAVVLFTGMTRDTNRGQDVVRLDYEAFAEMTGPEMSRIFADCLAASDGQPLRMICVHRTGVCEVGEASVAIAVASPHRDAAFHAARFLIDTLKERLPVWKKEVYQAGHHWIGDRS